MAATAIAFLLLSFKNMGTGVSTQVGNGTAGVLCPYRVTSTELDRESRYCSG